VSHDTFAFISLIIRAREFLERFTDNVRASFESELLRLKLAAIQQNLSETHGS
jgi:hypothetical protein